jgi:hypothetical protein
MGKFNYRPNPRVTAVLDDLAQYLDFCRDYGYRYDEADLGNWKSYAYQQYNKFLQGKPAKNMWDQLIRAARGV